VASGRKSPKIKCRAATDDGTPCKNSVTGPNQRCYRHKGLPALAIGERAKKPPKQAPSRTRYTAPRAPVASSRSNLRAARAKEREKRLVEEAVAYFEDAIKDGALAAATDHASEYASEKTWSRLTKGWSGRRCQALAQIARDVLDGKDQIHAGVGKFAGYVVGIFRGEALERAFAEEIAKRIPLPILDEKLTATARGLQITGIGVCFIQGYDISYCACFVDVAKTEGKALVKKMVLAGVDDWTSLRNVGLAK
jgi:hypothetical protein